MYILDYVHFHEGTMDFHGSFIILPAAFWPS